MSSINFPINHTKSQLGAEMLVLSRRIGERIHIGDAIVVTILGVNGNRVKIGIEAPKDVLIERDNFPPMVREANQNPRKPK